MRISDTLYFAPGIKFSDLDVEQGENLPDHFRQRIDGYYLEPARELAKLRHAFASGVLLVTSIDAVSGFEYGRHDDDGNTNTGTRFPRWCSNYLDSLRDDYCEQFYLNFRNGLVHESRIKNGGEFTLEIDRPVEVRDTVLSINPALLEVEVTEAVDQFVNALKRHDDQREELLDQIKDDFAYELDL